jgi:hypothetical protein
MQTMVAVPITPLPLLPLLPPLLHSNNGGCPHYFPITSPLLHSNNGGCPHYFTVLILKKFNKDIFLAVPISTKIKDDQYKVIFANDGKKYSANLSQMRVLDSKRLLRMIAKIGSFDFVIIKAAYHAVVK